MIAKVPPSSPINEKRACSSSANLRMLQNCTNCWHGLLMKHLHFATDSSLDHRRRVGQSMDQAEVLSIQHSDDVFFQKILKIGTRPKPFTDGRCPVSARMDPPSDHSQSSSGQICFVLFGSTALPPGRRLHVDQCIAF